MIYSSKTIKYYKNMKNVGSFDAEAPNVGTGIVGSPLCGDVMKIQLLFDDNGRIVDAKYKVFGCVSAIASMELACEKLKGLSIEEAMKIENSDVADELELVEIKRHCSVLAKESITAAINDYVSKKEGKLNDKFITITEKAIAKIKELIAAEGPDCCGILIGMIYGGCSGIEYSLSFATEDSVNGNFARDIDGTNFYFSEEDEVFIDGITIDFVDTGIGDSFLITSNKQFSCANCTCKRCG
jgi:nitrogen fixation NifU-like protein